MHEIKYRKHVIYYFLLFIGTDMSNKNFFDVLKMSLIKKKVRVHSIDNKLYYKN